MVLHETFQLVLDASKLVQRHAIAPAWSVLLLARSSCSGFVPGGCILRRICQLANKDSDELIGDDKTSVDLIDDGAPPRRALGR